MRLKAFDHVNVRTSRLQEMVEWYEDVLGLTSGKRPDFSFGGAWLYLGTQAIVHLVEAGEPLRNDEPTLEHFAISAEGLAEFTARLEARGIDFRIADVPGFDVRQVNLHDPDGNHIHIDFKLSAEGAGA